MRDKKRMVPPLDMLYGLIDSPFPQESMDLLFEQRSAEEFDRRAEEHQLLKTAGKGGYRLVSTEALAEIAEAIEKAMDESAENFRMLEEAINRPEEFRTRMQRTRRLLDDALARAPHTAE